MKKITEVFMLLIRLRSIFFFILIVSCTPQSEDSVEIKNSGVFDPVEISIDRGEMLGDFLIGEEPLLLTIKVKNNSRYNLTNLFLKIDEKDSNAAMTFNPNEKGESKSPGVGGTCGETLLAKKECDFVIKFLPNFTGELNQIIDVSYKNLVKQEKERFNIKARTGEAASLVFEGDEINYNLGSLERTSTEKREIDLYIVNRGGLPAKNIQFSANNSHASQPFKVKNNECKRLLRVGQKCKVTVEYQSKNFSQEAPDGNTNNINYLFDLTATYSIGSSEGVSSLTAYFQVQSKEIRAQIESAGLKTISFEDLVVGNIASQEVVISNKGETDGAIHFLEVVNSEGTLVARCVRDSADRLSCRNPSMVTNSAAELNLVSMPFKIDDLDQCVNDVFKINYTRDVSGVISDSSIRMLSASTDVSTETCRMKITFHPSIQHTTNGNYNDWSIYVVYDSTWKNNVDVRGYQSHPISGALGSSVFDIAQASYRSAATVIIDNLEYGGSVYPLIPGSSVSNRIYDLGRVSLITSEAYKQKLKIEIKNNGNSDAEIVKISDTSSSSTEIDENAKNLNSYYTNVKHVGCSVLNRLDGECSFSFDLSPLASSASNAQDIENGLMYDNISNREKAFQITYKNGSSVKDDMSPIEDKVLKVTLRSLLIRKGFLVFRESEDMGDIGTKVSGNKEYHHIIIENVGTGGIPYISGEDVIKYPNPKGVFPFRFVNRDSAEGGADKDCFDIIDFDGSDIPSAQSTNQASVLDSGKSCSLTVEYDLKSTDVRTSSFYGDEKPEWNRNFYQEDTGNESWEFKETSKDWKFSLKYYDGDGLPDTGTNYNPDLGGYGDYQSITGGSEGEYVLKVNFKEEGEIIPYEPTPVIASLMARESIELPKITKESDEWGDNIEKQDIDAQYRGYSKVEGSAPAFYGNKAKDLNVFNSDAEYTIYLGSFKAGTGPYDVSYKLKNTGSTKVEISDDSMDLGDSIVRTSGAITELTNQSIVNFRITPTNSNTGRSITDHEITFTNGRTKVTNTSTLAKELIEYKVKNRIVFDVLSENTGEITAELNQYKVTFNTMSNQVEEEYESTSTNVGTTYYGGGEEINFKAVRGADIYDKKRFTFSNSGANTINDVRFYFTEKLTDTSEDNLEGAGYEVSRTTCNGTSLNASESCYVEIKFKASESEVDSATLNALVSYEHGSNQYTSKGFRIKFTAVDPGNLAIQNTNSESITDSNGNIIENSYPVNFGFFGNNHVVLNNYPEQEATATVSIVNGSSEKASLLKQLEDVGGGVSTGTTVIYESGGVTVEADRECFYGDDELDSTIEEDERGFNDETNSACVLTVKKKFSSHGLLEADKNNIALSYYSSGRSSTSTLNLHFTGFVEPNRSNSSGNFNGLDFDENGDLTISWSDFTPQNSSWGSINGYRVYYSEGSTVLGDIFNAQGVNSIDTSSTSVTLTALERNRYYYIKVVALRTDPDGEVYQSDSDFGIKEIVVPGNNQFYNYNLGILVDKDLLDSNLYTLTQASNACSSARLTLSRNGAVVSNQKELVTSQIYNLINSSNSTYSYDFFPHWISDGAADVSNLFESFNCENRNGIDNIQRRYYLKSCSDCSCNTLPLIMGSDGRDFPNNSTIYADPSIMNAHARCYTRQ